MSALLAPSPASLSRDPYIRIILSEGLEILATFKQ